MHPLYSKNLVPEKLKGLLNTIFYLFRKDRKFYFKLVKMLGFPPGTLSYYRTAFIHKSASIQNKNGDPINNERLEFLGDAILGSIVAEYLYINFSNRDEGFMTKLRSRIVKRKNLNLQEAISGVYWNSIPSNPMKIKTAC